MNFTEEGYAQLLDRVEILFLRVQLLRQRLQNAGPAEVDPREALRMLGDQDGVGDALNGCLGGRMFPTAGSEGGA